MRNFSGNGVIIASNISQLRRVQTKHVMPPVPDPVTLRKLYSRVIISRTRTGTETALREAAVHSTYKFKKIAPLLCL